MPQNPCKAPQDPRKVPKIMYLNDYVNGWGWPGEDKGGQRSVAVRDYERKARSALRFFSFIYVQTYFRVCIHVKLQIFGSGEPSKIYAIFGITFSIFL